jgi:hypothetical protein
VKLTTFQMLAEPEQEMARAGRTREEAALRDARRALARAGSDVLTTGQAAGPGMVWMWRLEISSFALRTAQSGRARCSPRSLRAAASARSG